MSYKVKQKTGINTFKELGNLVSDTEKETWNNKLSSVPSATPTTRGTVFGKTEESSNGATTLGYNARSTSRYAVAIGAGSSVDAQGAIQIGAGSNTIPNSATFGSSNSPVNSLALYTTRNGVTGYHTVAFEEDLNNSGGNGESGGGSLPIGMIIPSAIVQNDAGLHLLDGGEILKGGVYDSFYNWVIENQDKVPTTTITDYTSDLSVYGQCGKFVINDTDTVAEFGSSSLGTYRIKLPKITKYIENLTDISEIGQSIGAGLPNITGETGGMVRDYNMSGAFASKNTISKNIANASTYNSYSANFDASSGETKLNGTLRNDVYGKSDTVQPQATKYPYYIVVGTVTKTDIKINIDNVTTDLNNKADKSGSNILKDSFRANLGIGEWVENAQSINTVSTSYTTIDISNFVSNYDENGEYEILIHCSLWGSTANYMNISSDIITTTFSPASISSSAARSTNTIVLPVKKTFKYNVYTTSGATNYSKIVAYRRIK